MCYNDNVEVLVSEPRHEPPFFRELPVVALFVLHYQNMYSIMYIKGGDW